MAPPKRRSKGEQPPGHWVTLAEFADYLGVTRAAIYRAIDSRRLSKSVWNTGEGTEIEADLGLEEWRENTNRPSMLGKLPTEPLRIDRSINPIKHKPGNHRSAMAPPSPGSIGGVVAPTVKKIPTTAEAKAYGEDLKNQLLELKLQQARGEVVAIADVARIVGHEFTNVRQRLLGIPSRLAPRLVHVTDAELIRQAIEDAVTEALEELTADRNYGAQHDDSGDYTDDDGDE